MGIDSQEVATMRDRREVLKLLAGGTAVAAGASLITTSTAFAAGGTTTCQPNNLSSLPTVTLGTCNASLVSNVGGDTIAARIDINGGSSFTVPDATCPTCHPGPGPSLLKQYKWSVDTVPVSGTYGFFALSSGGSQVVAFQNAPIPGTVHLRRTDTTNFPVLATPQNADFTIRLTLRWVCQNDFGGRTRSAWRCTSFTFVVRYRRSGNGLYSIALQTGPTASTEGPECDTGISA